MLLQRIGKGENIHTWGQQGAARNWKAQKMTQAVAVGTKFTVGSTQYVITSIEPVDPALTHLVNDMVNSGKDAVMYYASKVLKSGKQSVQGGMFYRFVKSGNFVKVL